eukprot:TRINITY_DN2238_c0_g1_i1.p1 TRINITY_DN2238_c0_g1~~TRINITY_DN2238_c0_g1_i1.p1  ORF type:complete len:254 (+),score=25.36 TRINITY_DN2238_c0_g1_i1:142-903(+)
MGSGSSKRAKTVQSKSKQEQPSSELITAASTKESASHDAQWNATETAVVTPLTEAAVDIEDDGKSSPVLNRTFTKEDFRNALTHSTLQSSQQSFNPPAEQTASPSLGPACEKPPLISQQTYAILKLPPTATLTSDMPNESSGTNSSHPIALLDREDPVPVTPSGMPRPSAEVDSPHGEIPQIVTVIEAAQPERLSDASTASNHRDSFENFQLDLDVGGALVAEADVQSLIGQDKDMSDREGSLSSCIENELNG